MLIKLAGDSCQVWVQMLVGIELSRHVSLKQVDNQLYLSNSCSRHGGRSGFVSLYLVMPGYFKYIGTLALDTADRMRLMQIAVSQAICCAY